jgi:hypothetical protein
MIAGSLCEPAFLLSLEEGASTVQSDHNSQISSDPVARILRAPGSIFRLAGLVLGIVAPFMPAFSRSGYDVTFQIGIGDAIPYAVALPIAAGVALLVSAIPQVSSYARLIDIAVAVTGIVICVQLLGMHGDGARAASSANRLSIGSTGPRATAGLEIGFWCIAGVAAMFAIAAIWPLRRKTNA